MQRLDAAEACPTERFWSGASDTVRVWDFALDEGSIYFSVIDLDPSAKNPEIALYRCPKSGCPESARKKLIGDAPSRLSVSGENLYYLRSGVVRCTRSALQLRQPQFH